MPKTDSLCAEAQSPRPQFISPDERKALISKADDLKRAGVINGLDVDILRYFFFKCPGAFTGFWWPSHAQIAAWCGVSDRTVLRALARMRKVGLIEWKARRRKVVEAVDGALAVVSHQLSNAYNFPAEFLRLSAEALAALRPVLPFDWQAQKRSREKVAARALPAIVPDRRLRDDDVVPKPPPLRLSAGLFATGAWRRCEASNA